MIEIVGVSFNNSKEVNYFLCNSLKLKKKITVIVETERGLEFGYIVKEPFKSDSKLYKNLKKVVRIATKDDYLNYKKNLKDARDALHKCRSIVSDKNINMVVMDAKYTFDRNQLIFRFLSDSRIDFRDLARELASIYKTRIELRQIGARDKACEIGGCGQCGRELCCSSFLKDLDTVSMSMAKNQNISLNPTKINGVCGRLMCCLKYEDECYKECRKCLPNVGSMIETDSGTGKVVSIDILKKKCKVDISNVGIIEVDCGSN